MALDSSCPLLSENANKGYKAVKPQMKALEKELWAENGPNEEMEPEREDDNQKDQQSQSLQSSPDELPKINKLAPLLLLIVHQSVFSQGKKVQ
jgi:hypothetical protein